MPKAEKQQKKEIYQLKSEASGEVIDFAIDAAADLKAARIKGLN